MDVVARAAAHFQNAGVGPNIPPPLDEIKAGVRAVCENRRVARVDLFGSVARGGARVGSDVDLLVEFFPDSETGLFEMGALKEDLEERLGCRVDLVTRRAVERSRNPIRRDAILTHRSRFRQSEDALDA